MQDGRKQAVSLRLGAGDIRKIKRLAKRLGVRDSDVIRYALKVTLAKLAPLCDPGVRGRALMPVFVDTGVDILQHFDLDEESLDRIINDGVDDEAHRVEHSDLQLMAMIGMQRGYAKLSLRELQQTLAATASLPPGGNDALDDTLSTSFRQHLYAKYVRPAAGPGTGTGAGTGSSGTGPGTGAGTGTAAGAAPNGHAEASAGTAAPHAASPSAKPAAASPAKPASASSAATAATADVPRPAHA